MTRSNASDDFPVKNNDDRRRKSILPNIFSRKERNDRKSGEDIFPGREIVFDTRSSSRIEGLDIWSLDSPEIEEAAPHVQEFRIFVATWNVGGRAPTNDLDLDAFLQVEGLYDIYVVGFQEIVPLNAGNVLVLEDNEPAAKWLALISQAINKPHRKSSTPEESELKSKTTGGGSGGRLFFQRPSLKVLSKNYRMDGAHVKTCNCPADYPPSVRQRTRQLREFISTDDSSSGEDSPPSSDRRCSNAKSSLHYCLVASKQMVGIFLSVWARRELVQHIGHVRVASIGRGIMGCLGNKGSIAMSMSLHQTSFCFICSHLASGEKEGDELKRNSDVAEILKSTQFPKICKNPSRRRIPEKILDHDRVIWFGDLNYRVSLSYHETRTLVRDCDWKALLEWDQLRIEKEAGRVFNGWKEGKISFAPTYKYSHNSDTYAGETVKSKKRRTPAWCDRILWFGNGIEQLQYLRGELRFSDHRPVCAVFAAQTEMSNNNNAYRMEELIPQRHSFY
ncbi:type I inositol polyphosphate 5-phosphatase 5-like [Canna indica]|uniref:Type I inositol polyphosphate 5-phosphatase 5-like n=1 Tax=Canna indica TaxID=4628 RepID=A0AAQ3QS53_9LILI|nr:type I inositol polyphosphate 5-phosphatase 5-like [Canna indica]